MTLRALTADLRQVTFIHRRVSPRRRAIEGRPLPTVTMTGRVEAVIVVIEYAAPGHPPVVITINGHRHLVRRGHPSRGGMVETIELDDEESTL